MATATKHTSVKKAARKGAAKKSAASKSAATKTTASKSATPRKPAKKPSSEQHCWPGFEPTPGKAAGEKGSCKPKPGKQTKSVRKADQKAAAASKQEKAH